MDVEQQEKLVVIKVLYSLSFVVAVSIHRARLGETSGVRCFQFRCIGEKKKKRHRCAPKHFILGERYSSAKVCLGLFTRHKTRCGPY